MDPYLPVGDLQRAGLSCPSHALCSLLVEKDSCHHLGHQEVLLVPLPQALTSSAAVPWSHWVPMGSLLHSSRPRSHASSHVTNKPRTTQPQTAPPGQQEQ